MKEGQETTQFLMQFRTLTDPRAPSVADPEATPSTGQNEHAESSGELEMYHHHQKCCGGHMHIFIIRIRADGQIISK